MAPRSLLYRFVAVSVKESQPNTLLNHVITSKHSKLFHSKLWWETFCIDIAFYVFWSLKEAYHNLFNHNIHRTDFVKNRSVKKGQQSHELTSSTKSFKRQKFTICKSCKTLSDLEFYHGLPYNIKQKAVEVLLFLHLLGELQGTIIDSITGIVVVIIIIITTITIIITTTTTETIDNNRYR